SHPANKGRELMLEYNERAVVSRVIIPAMLRGNAPEHLETAIRALPPEIRIAELEESWPAAFEEGTQLFPDLFRVRRTAPIKIRPRAEHHYDEAKRAEAAAALLTLGNGTQEMRMLGSLIDQSHDSLRNLYGVSTREVEQLRTAIKASPDVF